MKKLLLLLALLFVPLSASAQVGNMFLRPFAGVPSGACAEPLGFALNTTNGDFYSCDAGAWVKIGPGAAATGYQTIEEEGTPLTQRTTLNMIGGTVTCADNVTKTDCTFTAGGGTHDILSATHTDTTAAVVSRGSIVVGKLATPKWEELVLGGVNLYLKSDGTDLIYSTLAASGVGSCGANQFVTGDNADAAPTCIQPNFTDLAGTASVVQIQEVMAFVDLSDIASVTGSGTVGVLGTSPTILTSLNVGAAGANNILLQVNATTQAIFEGSVADAAETEFRITNCTDVGADCIVTFPDADTVSPQSFTCTNEFARDLSATTGATNCDPIVTADMPVAHTTFDKSMAFIDPTTADDDMVQWMHGKAVTYTDVDCSTDTGTATIDMDHRVITTPNTVGTDILTGTIICDTNNQADGGFADATIPANVPVNLSITAT
ncbi:hypothetical protein LCGC14_2313370, partial [marine sediment metagenome]